MNKKQPQKTKQKDSSPKEQYVSGQYAKDGKPFVVNFNKALDPLIANPNYPFQIGIAFAIKNPSSNGFPTREENEKTFKVEDRIKEVFEKDGFGHFVCSITGGGAKEYILYAKDRQEIEQRFSSLHTETKEYFLQLVVQQDPNWQVYKYFRPS
jgi:hypothetical protein